MHPAVDQLFQIAVTRYQSGNNREAAELCQQVLSLHPDHPDALHLLGLIARREGDMDRALALLQRVILAKPTSTDYRNNFAITLMQCGQIDRAITEFQQIVAINPSAGEAWSNLGSALFSIGATQQSAAAFSNAVELLPTAFEPRLGLGTVYRRLGKFIPAETALRQAIALRPAVAQAHVELGQLLFQIGKPIDGIHALQSAVAVAPGDVDVLNFLGNGLVQMERLDEAESIFLKALGINPRSDAVLNNLGNLYRVQTRADEALEMYRRAIAANPKQAAAYSNLGNTLRDAGNLPEAIKAFGHAVELDPASAAIRSNLAYACCFDPSYTAADILREARLWADRFETPLLARQRPHDLDRSVNRRLRIGYVSPDFRDHVIGRNVLPIVEHHDRDRFEIHGFSSLLRHDHLTEKFVHACDVWHECAGLSDSELATLIRNQHIDILIDLSLHMAGNRLQTFAEKPAPVQITWAGYPGTTGLRSIDYRLTDPHVDPPGTDEFYSEHLLRLPNSFWCFRGGDRAPAVNSLPALSSGAVTFGCLNAPTKVTEPSLALWSAVLNAVPNARMVLLVFEGSRRQEVINFFHSQGIDRSRVEFAAFVPSDAHLWRYHRIDIALDPLPYTGHTTTLEGLWMGVPVVTLSGSTSMSRGSVTALQNLGLGHLIAHTPKDYVRIAQEIAADVPALATLRQSLRARMATSPLCDEVTFTRDVESAYWQCWKRWVNPPG